MARSIWVAWAAAVVILAGSTQQAEAACSATLSSPTAGASVSFPQTFSWSASGNCISLAFATSSNPSTVAVFAVSGSSVGIPASSWTQVKAIIGTSGTYYWTVGETIGSTFYAATSYRSFSEAASCSASLSTPSAGASLTFPQNFTWSTSGTCTGLALAFGTSASPSSVAMLSVSGTSGSVTATQWEQIKGIIGTASTYYWTVGESSGTTFTARASYRSFTVSTTTCTATLNSPSAGAALTFPQNFSWSTSGTCTGLALAFGTSASPSSVATLSVSGTSGSVTATQWEQIKGIIGTASTYYWTVGESSGTTFTARASYRSFTVSTTTCTATLNSPSAGAALTFPQNFSWSTSGTCTGLALAFGTSASPSSVATLSVSGTSGSVTATQWEQIKGIIGTASTYYWTVGESSGTTFTARADYRSFTAGSTSTCNASLSNPAAGASLTFPQTFSWSTSGTCTGLTLAFATSTSPTTVASLAVSATSTSISTSQWTQAKAIIGTAATYYWTIGESVSGVFTPRATFRAFSEGLTVLAPTRTGTRVPLSSSMATPALEPVPRAIPPHESRQQILRRLSGTELPGVADPLAVRVQARAALLTPTLLRGFEGLDLNGSLPSDSSGSIGPQHYFEWVNTEFAIFTRTGTMVYGPAQGNVMFAGMSGGGPCVTHDDGDPVVLYDQLAARWFVSQFAVTNNANSLCIAVSTGSNPLTSSWYLYEYNFGTVFPDYEKYGIWDDMYTMTFHGFNDGTYSGTRLGAFNRTAMLSGSATAQLQFYNVNTALGGEFFGTMPPRIQGAANVPGIPAPFVHLASNEAFGGSDRYTILALDADFATPANTALTRTDLAAAAFNQNLCDYASCVPQPGTSVRLATLSGNTMFQVVVRDLDASANLDLRLLAQGTVDADGGDQAGIRWIELRSTGGAWSVRQQSTFAPDSRHRFMASIAMNAAGDIAIGYSVSDSTSTYPAIWATGRLAGDTLNTMPQGERVLRAGMSSQTHSSGRWGDYTMLDVDPVDDRSFWHVNQYVNGGSWATFIAQFELLSAAPTVTAILPAVGPPSGGTAVTITGSNFTTGATVALGGASATSVSVVNSTTITAVTAARSAGTVNVVVTNPGSLVGTLTNGFTYAIPPTLSSITPATGTTAGGTKVKLTGTNFVTGAGVRFGGTAATNVVVQSATTLTATSPARAAGSVTVSIVNPDTQIGSLANAFTYQVLAGSAFTDPTLSAGSTVIKAAHFNELRERINEQLVRFGQPIHQFTNSIAIGSVVQATDLLELYTAANKALQAASRPTITVPNIATGVSAIQGSHINALRAVVVMLEGL
jgi:hypothetical protein